MKDNKKLFRERAIYPIVFMIIITVIFVGGLSFFYNSQKIRIQDNQQISYYRNILEIFNNQIQDVDFNLIPDEEILTFKVQYLYPNSLISEKGERNFFKVVDKGALIGYCFDITGAGLWGTMKAVVGFEPNLETLIDFNVYEQVETPGLGGRISEPADKLNLRADLQGTTFLQDGDITNYQLISESSEPESQKEIRQITGATITSSSFIKMLKQEMSMIIPLFNEEMAKGE